MERRRRSSSHSSKPLCRGSDCGTPSNGGFPPQMRRTHSGNATCRATEKSNEQKEVTNHKSLPCAHRCHFRKQTQSSPLPLQSSRQIAITLNPGIKELFLIFPGPLSRAPESVSMLFEWVCPVLRHPWGFSLGFPCQRGWGSLF